MTPNSARTHACAVGIAPAVELVLVAELPPITLRRMLNWSDTCCSLNALAPLGSAVYQSGFVKYVGVVVAIVTSVGIL